MQSAIDLLPDDIASLPPKARVVALLREKARRKKTNRLFDYKPYPKQIEFHKAGAEFREVMLSAGNQLGKTLSAGFEMAMHLTGRYPDWWCGRRYKKPIVAWGASVTMEVSRDAMQRILLGRDTDRGTGAIPLDDIHEIAPYPGVRGAAAQAKVKHQSGGLSLIIFKSYDQGRTKFQGDTIDEFWADEEPPEDIYSEGLTRTNASRGKVMMTFTPLMGMTSVAKRFFMEQSNDRKLVQMTIEDALHYTEEERARIIASYPAHEREARTKGIPTLGSGRVFPIVEESIKCDAFKIPDHWFVINGIDFGWDHPTAGAQIAIDRDTDTVYVTACYKRSQSTPAIHAIALKEWGAYPWSWPHDGLQHDKGSGDELASLYKKAGLNMLHGKAEFVSGGNGVEAGIADMLDRMQTGRFKVFSHLNEWFDEFRIYHRKDGKIVKENDDAISATRYALMMQRFAVPAKRVENMVSVPMRGRMC